MDNTTTAFINPRLIATSKGLIDPNNEIAIFTWDLEDRIDGRGPNEIFLPYELIAFWGYLLRANPTVDRDYVRSVIEQAETIVKRNEKQIFEDALEVLDVENWLWEFNHFGIKDSQEFDKLQKIKFYGQIVYDLDQAQIVVALAKASGVCDPEQVARLEAELAGAEKSVLDAADKVLIAGFYIQTIAATIDPKWLNPEAGPLSSTTRKFPLLLNRLEQIQDVL